MPIGWEDDKPDESNWMLKVGNIHDNPELLNAASATTGNSHMNIDPNEKAAEEVKEQAAEQATEATGTESAEEEGTEG